jgi:indolepyruvate ferredoxin oxidoreductase alpha subunit
VAAVIDSCVGCGLCGEVAHAAVLCPSFYRAQIVTTPPAGTASRRAPARVRDRLAAVACAARRAQYAF